MKIHQKIRDWVRKPRLLSANLKELLTQDLQRHEGRRRKPYNDSLGVLTIGIGRNLERGLSDDEIDYLFANDLRNVERQVSRLPIWGCLNDARRGVLFNMAFQLGYGGLLKFRKMLAALDVQDYAEAAAQMLDSRWAQQTPKRARELAQIMAAGRRP